jgi:hypothetical protein
LSIPGGTTAATVTVTNSKNITSASKLADASGKGVVCLDISVAVTNIEATAMLYTPLADPGNGTPFIVTGGIQSVDPAAACPAGTDAWIQSFGADTHRASTNAGVVYVAFN